MSESNEIDPRGQRAMDAYRKDARFHAMARGAVSQVMKGHGSVDTERADQEAYEIALRATILLLQTVYEDDAEIAWFKAERDTYKRIAEEITATTPFPVSPSPVVSEEMVDEAMREYDRRCMASVYTSVFRREAMRAALTAALGVR